MKNNLKLFSIELFFFFFTLILGIFVSYNIGNLSHVINAAQEVEQPGSYNALLFIGYFFLATLIIFLVSKSDKYEKGKILFFKSVFLISVALGSLITFSIFFSDLTSFFLVTILILTWKSYPLIILHNFLISFSIAGIGAVVGTMFSVFEIVVLLVVFSVYDFVAVYKTKHMVKMATEMIKTKAIMGLIVPIYYKDLVNDLGKEDKSRFMILGGGDLSFPLFLVSAVTLAYGVKEALFLTAFACLGLFASFFLFMSQEKKRAIPALPPIAFFLLIGYLLVYLI
jgi:presenilin-like A22 family membrane protease